MQYILPFTEVNQNHLTLVGGKGANLGEMVTAGLPVPPGFVLTTAAYDLFIKAQDLQSSILDLANQVLATDSLAGEQAAEAIKTLFMQAELPAAIAADVLAAYHQLPRVCVAVRSSATAEDLPHASFAGQQDTFLNICGEESLPDTIKACWASLWTARAIAYRARLGIDHQSVSMAVIIQEMVPAEVSGVLFTANPATGARDELVVNAAYGLGEAVVSGRVTPDTYIIDRQRLQVKETTLGTKEVMFMPAEEQLTTTRPVPDDLRNQPAISSAHLRTLATLAMEVEENVGGIPQDIEWAVADDHCWLLQARPITNLPPPPLKEVRWEPPRPGTIWMRRQVVEHMPEPLSPLFDELYLQEGLDQSLDAMADSIANLIGMQINVWDFVDPPFATTVNGYAYSMASFKMNWHMVPLALRIYITALPKMLRYMIPYWREEALPAYQATIHHWNSLDLAQTEDHVLLRGIRELALADATYWFSAAVPLGIARTTDAALDRFVQSVAGGRAWANGAPLTSGHFLRGFPSKALDAQIHLEAIAGEIGKNEQLRKLVITTPAATLQNSLATHPAGPPILDDLQQYLGKYGHQIYNLDFAVPTLADDPLPVLLSLKAAVANPPQDARTRQKQQAQERKKLVANMERHLNPIFRWIFHLLLGWAQRYTPYRDEALFYVGAAWPTLRRLALEIGRRLVATGALTAADDVFYLRRAELETALLAIKKGQIRLDLAGLARERRDLRAARQWLEPPVIVPPDGRLKFGPIDMAMLEPKARDTGDGPVLNGNAVSPGRVTAPASVIRTAQDFDQMLPDTILVCTTTTPAWTPLFSQAQGLVTDIGGALAHGSIVAREYGIPAVMGTGAATQRITSGQLIQVDGNTGTVTLVEESGRGELEKPQEKSLASRLPLKRLLALTVVGVGLALWWRKRKNR